MMVQGDLNGSNVMKLTRGVLIYEDSEAATASMHDVERDPQTGAPLLMPGCALTPEAMGAILKKLAGNISSSRSLLPSNLLCYEAGRLIWYVPSHRRTVFFKTADKEFDKVCNGKNALHPTLLFVAENKRLWVFALESDKRPNGNTPLYRAPYLNLYEGGSMCAGTGRVPNTATPKDIEAWEKLFFDTNFSHTNSDGRNLSKHPRGHNGLWLELVREKGRGTHRAFPTRFLTPTKKKLKDLLNGAL